MTAGNLSAWSWRHNPSHLDFEEVAAATEEGSDFAETVEDALKPH